MAVEPVGGQLHDPVERARLLEEMGCTGHDLEMRGPGRTGERLAVQLDHDIVEAADDEEDRGPDGRDQRTNEIRAAAARDDGAHRVGTLRGEIGRAWWRGG